VIVGVRCGSARNVDMARKYELPGFLQGKVTHEAYERWPRRKAQAHVTRDRQRGNETAIGEAYRNAVHTAVISCQVGTPTPAKSSTGALISKYDNFESQSEGRTYKHSFAGSQQWITSGPANFQICGWRTNDAKHDLELPELLCRAVLQHHGFTVAGGS
jgi:hypothetical protein